MDLPDFVTIALGNAFASRKNARMALDDVIPHCDELNHILAPSELKK